jgi:hypothetical protein
VSSVAETLFKFKGEAKHFLVANSPAILTGIGISGTLTTAYLTGKASYEAAGIIRKAEMGEPVPEDFLELMQSRIPHVWRLYIPAASTGAVTVVCIVMATRIGTRRTAAAAAAYSITEKAFGEYKEKVAEVVGVKKETEVRDSIAQDEVLNHPPSKNQVMLAGPGKVLCYDPYNGRYFHSDMESLRRAQNAVNAQLLRENYATVNDFYDSLGVYCSENADNMGWQSKELLDLTFSAVLYEEVPVLSFRYNYVTPNI